MPKRIVEAYRLKKLARLAAPAQSVLDVGCACMPNPYLRNEVVVGLDLMKPELPTNYTAFHVSDAMRLPHPFEPEEFDAVVCGEMLEHLKQPNDFLSACFKVLNSRGFLVLSTPNPHSLFELILNIPLSRSYYYDPEHVCLYPQRWLIRMLELSGFTRVRLYSGGICLPFVYLSMPFPRPWAEYTIAVAQKK